MYHAHFLCTGNLVCQTHFLNTGQIEYHHVARAQDMHSNVGEFPTHFPDTSCTCPGTA